MKQTVLIPRKLLTIFSQLKHSKFPLILLRRLHCFSVSVAKIIFSNFLGLYCVVGKLLVDNINNTVALSRSEMK